MTADKVLRCAGRSLVGNVFHVNFARELEKLHRQMVGDTHSRGTVVEYARPCPEVGNELLGGMRRHRRMHSKDKDARSYLDDWREALHWIVGNVLEKAQVRRGWVGRHQLGVSCGCWRGI